MPVCNLSELLSLLKPGETILGLDPGETIGIAISDPGHIVASPLAAIAREKSAVDIAKLIKIIEERKVGAIIVGLPKNMDGSEGPSAQSARALVRNLLRIRDLPASFWDERLSTAAVERLLIADDMTRKRRGSVIDKAAAAYILQGALDRLQTLKNQA